MQTFWRFSIYTYDKAKLGPNAIGVTTTSLADMRLFGSIIEWDKEIKIPCSIEIDEPEGSPRLIKLLQAIKERYGFEPSPSRMVPVELRDRYFGLYKVRHYSREELEAADYLHIALIPDQIAEHHQGSDEPSQGNLEISADPFESEDGVSIGFMFTGIFAMTAQFKNELSARDLRGFTPTLVKGVELWRLGSSIVLPRSLLKIQDDEGQYIDPDFWPNKTFNSKYWDDDGYGPVELRYRRSDMVPITPFDVAFTYERMGGPRYSFRELIVSQRFRKVMEDLGQRGIEYAPVRLV